MNAMSTEHVCGPIDTMMREHRLIEQVLASLAALAAQLETNPAAPRERIAQFADFFRNFADRCHHGKEEDQLFAKLNECGFPREHGPVGVMLAEHAEGRRHVEALSKIGAGTGPLRSDEAAQVVSHARQFIPLLLDHIRKEDHVLYPMARQAIPADGMIQLDTACRAYDQDRIGPLEIQRLRDLAAELLRIHPPHPGVLAPA